MGEIFEKNILNKSLENDFCYQETITFILANSHLSSGKYSKS